jgi:hypothetical protein
MRKAASMSDCAIIFSMSPLVVEPPTGIVSVMVISAIAAPLENAYPPSAPNTGLRPCMNLIWTLCVSAALRFCQ